MTSRLTERVRTTFQSASILDIYTLFCGIFLVLAPALFGFVRAAGRVDAEVSGVVLIALSAASFLVFTDWEEWLKVAVGVWLIAAPWLLGFVHTSAMHVSVAIGVIVAFLTLIEIWLAHDPDFARDARTTQNS